jgi:hypothetical protein
MTRPSWMIFVTAAIFLALAVIGLFLFGGVSVRVELPPAAR